MADVNGDGLTDIIHAYRDPSNQEFRTTHLNTGNRNWTVSPTWQSPLIAISAPPGEGFRDLGVRFVDVNGDNLTDIVQSNDFGSRTFLNNSSGWAESSQWQPPLKFASGNGSLNPANNGQLADLNGDGLLDTFRALRDPFNPSVIQEDVFLNTGNGWARANWQIPADQREIALTDVNSDGLTDILESYLEFPSTPHLTTYLNQGDGNWEVDTSLAPPIPFYHSPPSSPYDQGFRAVDINSDGLVDLVQKLGGVTRTFLNRGNAWQDASILWNVWRVTANNAGTDTSARLVDINGDGMVDQIEANGPPGSINDDVILNIKSPSDKLISMTLPNAGTLAITYKSSALYREQNSLANPSLPMIVQTVD